MTLTGLLEALLSFVADDPRPELDRFRHSVAHWGQSHAPRPAASLPAARHLDALRDGAEGRARVLLDTFVAAQAGLRWEQSYRADQGLVGDDMLAGYGFAEVIGKLGPYVSAEVRAGLGIWGPQIDYPAHRHGAEEIYVPLSGRAEFRLDDGESPFWAGPERPIYIAPMRRHGFRTGSEAFAVFYIWQAGDLREQSQFG